MRAKLLLPVLPAALLVLAGCDIEDLDGFAQYHKDFHYSYPLKAGGRLGVETFNGSVEVSTWDQDMVDISGTKYGRSQAEADELRIDIDHGPASVAVRAIRPSDRRGNAGARFVIKVPRGTVFDTLVSSNGAIRVVEAVGPARLKTSNGQIQVKGMHGALRAETSNGAIELLDIQGGVAAHTSNGHIRAEGLSGALDATTSNGSIHARLDRADGEVRLESSNGSLDLTLPPNSACPVRAHTNNSNITVRLPGQVNARVSARTSNGSVSSEFELRVQGEFSKHSMEGTIGSGGPLLDLSTSNSSIRLLR